MVRQSWSVDSVTSLFKMIGILFFFFLEKSPNTIPFSFVLLKVEHALAAVNIYIGCCDILYLKKESLKSLVSIT